MKGENLGGVFDSLTKRYGREFKKRLFDKEGKPKRFINIYINGKDMRFLDGLETKLKRGDEILIIPAVSGG
jgi:MoaD family protein